MPRKQNYVNLAREAWDEVAPIHWKVTHALRKKIRDPDHREIHEVQMREIERVGLRGARVAQLNCNNGRELISIKRMGANYCVGFDISAKFIEQARILASEANAECNFICSDVYEIESKYDERFDIVVVTAGALAYMPDLQDYFSVAARLLRSGGYLTVYETHPVMRMFPRDRDRKGEELKITTSYFDNEPLCDQTGLDYQGGTTYSAKPIYYFRYKMSDIVMAFLAAGFQIDRFSEHDRDPSLARISMEDMKIKPPMSYILTGHKAN